MQKSNFLRRLRTTALNLFRPKVVFPSAILILLIAVPFGARAQFGLDPCCAIISAGLNTISGLLSNVVAKPLNAIHQIQQDASNFEQQVIYPASAIANAKGVVVQVQGQLRQIGQPTQFRSYRFTSMWPGPTALGHFITTSARRSRIYSTRSCPLVNSKD